MRVSVGSPPATRGIITKKGSSPLHFLRVLRYSKPYMRYLYPALGCVVFVALTYSLNIMALLPMIKIIVGEQGIPAWIHQVIAEDRLDIHMKESDGRIRFIEIDDDSLLAGKVNQDDLLVRIDDDNRSGSANKSGDASDLLSTLAYADSKVALHLIIQHGDSRPNVEVTPKPVPVMYRLSRGVVSWMPKGNSSDSKMTTLFIIVIVVLFIGLIGAVCRFFGEYLIALVAGRTVVTLRRHMYERVLRFPVSYYATRGVSDLVSRFVQDSQDIYRGLNYVFAKSLREPLKALFVFFVALMIDWRITMIAVIAAPLAGLIIRKFGRRIRKANRGLLENYARMLSSLNGALSGIRVVKGYGLEKYERHHLFGIDQGILKHQLKIARTEAMSSPVFEMIGRIAASIAIVYFAQLMLEGTMTFSKFATLAACMAGMFDPVRKMSSFYNKIQRANAALDRVFEVIDTPVQEEDDHNKSALSVLQETIEFRNVTFTYPNAEHPALDDVNLVVKRGERVAIVGANGSGKTTLVSLLIRFFDPQKGIVLFDGRDVRDCSLISLRRQMSLITQDAVLFADTLAINIAYGDDRLLRRLDLCRRHPKRSMPLDADRERIVEAAQAAYADDFIRRKPNGYDTPVGEHGVTLSGGERQRIAIARAILRNAPIFIFDEATSQIDAESEQKIHRAVERFLEGRTALIIAHRFSTILQADRIVVMDHGRIVDSGRHDELIERCAIYQSLYGSQIIKDHHIPQSEGRMGESDDGVGAPPIPGVGNRTCS